MKKTQKILIGVVLLTILLGIGAGASALLSPREGYMPYQPIFFQHKKMAAKPNWVTGEDGKEVNMGGYDIPCIYCHTMPYKGRHSTLPSTDICMNCHSTVGQDKEWVLKLLEYWDAGKPIQWVKVHDLPDFAYYDHSAHLNVVDENGKLKLDCVDCHGEVENTEMVSVQNRFNMGWCLDCHRKPDMNASIDCYICHR